MMVFIVAMIHFSLAVIDFNGIHKICESLFSSEISYGAYYFLVFVLHFITTIVTETERGIWQRFQEGYMAAYC